MGATILGAKVIADRVRSFLLVQAGILLSFKTTLEVGPLTDVVAINFCQLLPKLCL